MTPRDLFGVFVKTIGLGVLLNGIPAAFANPYVAIGDAIVGVALLASGEAIAKLCYPDRSIES